MNVQTMLEKKGGKVVTAPPGMTILAISHLLNAERIGALIVSSDGERIEGIISERDVARGLAAHGQELPHMHARDLMTREVMTCGPEDDIKMVMSRMTHGRIRHLPVVAQGKLCGIISIGDVVKNRLEELEMETSVLRDYAVARG